MRLSEAPKREIRQDPKNLIEGAGLQRRGGGADQGTLGRSPNAQGQSK